MCQLWKSDSISSPGFVSVVYFFKWLFWTNSVFFLVWNSVCMLGNNFNTPVRLLFISLYFLLAQNLKFSKRLDFLRSSWACTQSSSDAVLSKCTWASRFPRICWGFTSLPCFPFKLLFSLLSQLLPIASGSCNVKQLPLGFCLFVCWQTSLGKKAFSHWVSLKSCHVKRALQVESSRELLDRSNNDQFSRRVEKAPTSFCSFPWLPYWF